MFNKAGIFAAFAMAFIFAFATDAFAQGCGLKEYASLPMTVLPNGELSVPATVAGQTVNLIVVMAGANSLLSQSFVDSASLRKKRIPENVDIGIGNWHAKETTTADLTLGAATGHGAPFIVDDRPTPNPNVVGTLGPNILQTFDVELDFSKMTMNLFSHDHCVGKVVYWAGAYAAVPMNFDKADHPNIAMQLDGKQVSVGFYLQLTPAVMALATAKRIFAIDEHAAGLAPLYPGPEPKLFSYPFKTLSVEGLSISNPKIVLDADISDCQPSLRVALDKDQKSDDSDNYRLTACYGRSEVELGIAELRKLHLYFAFGEKVLYLTAADAQK